MVLEHPCTIDDCKPKIKKKKDNFLCLQENVADGAVMHYLLYRTILFLCMKIIRVNCLPSVYLCQTFFLFLGMKNDDVKYDQLVN